MSKDIQAYNDAQSVADALICNRLVEEIYQALAEAEHKIWHAQ